MKKILFASCALALSFSAALAQNNSARKNARPVKGVPADSRPYGSAGCGLGSAAFGGGDGFNQVFAATTNGSSGQPFAITTGTSNCVPADGASAQNLKEWMPQFLEANRAQFETDLVRGQGETLDSIAWAAGCESSSELGDKLQHGHSQLLDASVSVEDLSSRLMQQLSGLSCKNLG